MTTKTDKLRAALSEALVLADGEAIDAAGVLIDAVAEFLDLDPSKLAVGEPLPA